MTRISFLMPTYNRAHLIEESIASILPQMSDDDELIVIDDGSTDGTGDVLTRFGDRIVTYRQENSGKSVALNYGLTLTSGKYIWICDDDDLLRPGVVDVMYRSAEQRGVDFLFARYSRFIERNGRRIDIGTGYWPDLDSGSLPRHVLEDSFVMQNSCLVRRSAYEVVGPFDQTLFRSLDYDMAVRLATQTKCAYEGIVAFDQRKHDGARGPSKIRHAEGRSEEVWKEYDRQIFTKQFAALPLAYYESMFVHDDREIVTRAALLQRACIMGRHDLWEYALDDLEAASSLATDVVPGKLARDICKRIVSGKHGFSGILEPQLLDRLRVIRDSNRVGNEIVNALLRGTLWLFRDRSEYRHDARKLIAAVGRPGRLTRLSVEHLIRKFRSPDDTGLIERTSIPPFREDLRGATDACPPPREAAHPRR